jgi:4-hydroxy-2-oxoheptanedioate aldolase
MQGHQVRESLHNGQVIYGTHVCGLINPIAAQILSMAPIDFAFIGTEHMPLDRSELSIMCHLYAAKGISPVVRIPYPCGRQAAMAMDGGAQGIVAPYVETVQEVREIVGAVRYRPLKGELLEQFLDGSREPDDKTISFLDRFNQENYTIIGIESVAAYKNLNALISVPGVDGVFIGPHDLTCSLEAPEEYDNPDFIQIIEDIIVRCRDASVGVGLHFVSTAFSVEQVRRFIELGMNWVIDGSDAGHAQQNMFQRRRQLCGDEKPHDRGVASQNISSCQSSREEKD